MRVSVTGASGFLGSAVMRTLLKHDIEAIGYSRNFHNALKKIDDYENIVGGDCLIHLAENNNRAEVNNLGVSYLDSIVRICRSLTDGRFTKVVYASSALLYEDQRLLPLCENDKVLLVDTYTKAKHLCEELVLSNASNCVARISNLYGPNMRGGNVFNDILDQLVDSPKIWLKNTKPIRDFLWYEDAADAIVNMVVNPAAKGIINLGSGRGTSILDLANLFSNISEKSSLGKKVICDLKKSDSPSSIILDISKANNLLNWTPKVDLEDGIKCIISKYQIRSKNAGS